MPAHTLRSGNSKHPSSNLHTVNSSDRSTEPSDSETEKVSGFPPVSASPYPGDRGGYSFQRATCGRPSRSLFNASPRRSCLCDGEERDRDPLALDWKRPYPKFSASVHADQSPACCDPHPYGLTGGVPATLSAIPYFLIAAILVQVINDGGPAWLNMLVLLSIWNGLKMLWIGPMSLMLFARALRRRVQ